MRLAEFSRTDLRGADFSDATDIGNLGLMSGAIADDAHFDRATEIHFTLDDISLKGATFRGTRLILERFIPIHGSQDVTKLGDPNFDAAILDCGYFDEEWLGRQSSETQRKFRAYWQFQAAAVAFIVKTWPSAEVTPKCKRHVASQ